MMRRFGSAAVAAGAAVALLVGVVAGPGAATEVAQTPSAPPRGAASLPAAATLPAAAVPDFTDVDASNPFAEDIAWLAEQGITTGYADGSFRPLASVNRDAMAAFLYRLVVGPEAPASCTAGPFTDVPTAHPFCPQISWLVGEGVTTGWPDGTYRPASAVSREAMAAFLYRVGHEGADAPACTTARFSDVPVSSPFCGEIAWLAEQGVTTGWPDGTFRPGASIERQAMAAFLHRYALLTPPEEPVDPDAPQVSIDEPLPGSMVGGTVTVTTSWLATTDLASLDLLVDGEVVATADAEPFDLTWDTTAASDGAHELTVVATDAEDRTGTSEPVGVSVHQGPDPLQTLEDDYTSGAVTPEEYARYAVYRWFEPERVPDEYRVPEGYGTTDLTPALMAALRDVDSIDPEVRAELQAYLSPQGVEPLSLVPLTPEQIDAALAPYIAALEAPPAPARPADGLAAAEPAGLTFGEDVCHGAGVEVTWRFPWSEGSVGVGVELACTYTTALATFWYKPGWGTQDVDVLDGVLRDAGHGGGANGVPDSIDEIAAAYFHSAWVYERLGFPAPSKTHVAVGEFDGGFSAPVLGTMVVDGRMPDAGDAGGRVYLMQHELFHQFQYPYVPLDHLADDYASRSQSSVGWWLEATAEWGTHQVQEDLRYGTFRAYTTNAAFVAAGGGYADFLPHHLGLPTIPLATFISPFLKPFVDDDDWKGPQYGSFLFAEYLDQEFGQSVIHDIWQRVDDGALPVTAIAAEVAAQGSSIADVVPGYHRANAAIDSSYTDAHSATWASLLDDGRPAGAEFRATVGTSHGSIRVGAGGAQYHYFTLSSVREATTTTVSIDSSVPGAADLTLEVVQLDGSGARCFIPEEPDVVAPLEAGHAEVRFTLVGGCPTAAVIVSHEDPTAIFDDGGKLKASMTARTEEVHLAYLSTTNLGATSPSKGVVSGIGGGWPYLVDENGRLLYAGADTGIVETGLEDVVDLAVDQFETTAGYAITADGSVVAVDGVDETPVPALAGAGTFVTDLDDVGRYVLMRDGSLRYLGADGYPAVEGAAGVVQVSAYDDYYAGVPGARGYAVTADGSVLMLDDATATVVPGVTGAVEVSSNAVGTDAFVRHADGTISVLTFSGGPWDATIPRVVPVPGLTGATEIVNPTFEPEAWVRTAAGGLVMVECSFVDCTEVLVRDSGLTDVETVVVHATNAEGNPTYVVTGSGDVLELYGDWDDEGDRTVVVTDPGVGDVVHMERHSGLAYALHSDGSVTEFGYPWNEHGPVTGVLGADTLFCTSGACFVTFD